MQDPGFLESDRLFHRAVVPFLLLVVLLYLAYSNTFQVPFIFDDQPNILLNTALQFDHISVDKIVKAATSLAKNRWLPNISFALNFYYAGEGEMWGFHLVNLIIHLSTAMVFYALAVTTLTLPIFKNRYSRPREIALAATLLWALHPLQTNAVTYIVQRMTSMSALFYLTSLLFYVRGRLQGQSGKRAYYLFAASAVCGFMAIVSKENAVMLPIMMVVYELFLLSASPFKENRRNKILACGLAALMVLVFVFVYLGQNFVTAILAGFQARPFTLTERLLTESRVLFFYLSLLPLPLPSRLNLCHDIVVSRNLFVPIQTAAALISLVALVALAAYLFRRERMISFAIFWFIGNLLIESTVIPLELIFEHRLYLPSTFLLLAVTAAGYRLVSDRVTIRRLAIAVMVISCCFLTWERNKAWASGMTMWQDVVAKSPNLVRGYLNLGVEYLNAGQKEKGEQLLLQGVAVGREKDLGRPGSYLNVDMAKTNAALSSLFWETERWDESIIRAEQALRHDPKNTTAMVTKGLYYEKKGRSDLAVAMYSSALMQGEESVVLFNSWGISYFHLGMVDDAIRMFQRALAIDDEDGESHYNLGIAYGNKGKVVEARQEMLRAMQLQQQPKKPRPRWKR